MPRKKKIRDPSQRKLIDLPIWVLDAINAECEKRKDAGKPVIDSKSYIEKLCALHVVQQLNKK